jgi:hypothetical protein
MPTPIDPDRHDTLTQTHQYMFCFTPAAIDIRSAQYFPQGWFVCIWFVLAGFGELFWF